MTSRTSWFAAALLTFAVSLPAAAQTPPPTPVASASAPTIVELRLKDGSVIFGLIQRETPDRLALITLAGAVVEVDRAQVVSVLPARGQVVDGQFWKADSNATRLFFAP